jgi:alkylation response protein AidB-like acyl-CoA dehydrogenase
MQFSLTEEHAQVAATVRQLLTDGAHNADNASSADSAPAAPDRLNGDLLATLAKLDLLGLAVPEALGGAGATTLELVVLAEEIGAALPLVPFAASAVVSTLVLAAHEEPEAHAALSRLVDGTATSTTAWMTFPGELRTGSPAGTVNLRLADGAVSGELVAIPFGADADFLLVFVNDTTALLDLTSPGVRRTRTASFDLSEPTASITLDGVPPLFLSTPAQTAKAIRRVAPAILTALAGELLGTGRQALDNAIAYANQREQFGRVIGSFQALKHMLADRYVQLEAARGLVHYAAWACEGPQPGAELAARGALAAASDAALAAAADNLQTHGGIGFTWEQSAHRYLRRARARRSLLGTPARQLDHIAERILTPARG